MERTHKKASAGDPFRSLGLGAPIFRAIFAGATFPIQDREDLIRKAGGEGRVIRLSDGDGQYDVYSLIDVLDAFDEPSEFFPLSSPADLANKYSEYARTEAELKKPSILDRIDTHHLTSMKHRHEYSPRANKSELRELIEKKLQESSGTSSRGGSEFFLKAPPQTDFGFDWAIWIAMMSASAADYAADRADALLLTMQVAQRGFDATMSLWRQGEFPSDTTYAAAEETRDEICAAAEMVETEVSNARAASNNVCLVAQNSPSNTALQDACVTAQQQVVRAQAAADAATEICESATEQLAFGRELLSIDWVVVRGRVESDFNRCCPGIQGARVWLENLDFPEVVFPGSFGGALFEDWTDSEGRFSLEGPFGPSDRGNPRIRLLASHADHFGHAIEFVVDDNGPQSRTIRLRPRWLGR